MLPRIWRYDFWVLAGFGGYFEMFWWRLQSVVFVVVATEFHILLHARIWSCGFCKPTAGRPPAEAGRRPADDCVEVDGKVEKRPTLFGCGMREKAGVL